ncbi:hypothetical protein V7793_06015 [Streptomyces sp. KLMMK]|uniref:hypothetical protein n=1 Tax=Streptomyces sp. KLMMK TaxID=3109353 RepID=UPI002FFF95FC
MPSAALCSAVLTPVLSPGEVRALAAARFIGFPHRTVIALIASGWTRRETARALQLTPGTVASYLVTAAQVLGSSPRAPAVVHAAYCHPSYPTPPRSIDSAPRLTPGERAVLLNHARGGPRSGDRTLLIKLRARSPAQAVDLAWRWGLLSSSHPPAAANGTAVPAPASIIPRGTGSKP